MARLTGNPRFAVDAPAFRHLVRGRIATLAGPPAATSDLILSDIGWARMFETIVDAMNERGQRFDSQNYRPPFCAGEC